MTVRHVARNADAVYLWFACAIALAAGSYLAFGLLGAAIDLQTADTRRVSMMVVSEGQRLAQRPALRHDIARLEAPLAGLKLDADKPATVARFIREVDRIAAAHHATLLEIDERPTAPAAASTRSAGTPTILGSQSAIVLPPLPQFDVELIPLDVSLGGDYGDLLATIGDVARAGIALQIEIAAIERNTAASAASSSALRARLHINLERFTSHPTDASLTHTSWKDSTDAR